LIINIITQSNHRAKITQDTPLVPHISTPCHLVERKSPQRRPINQMLANVFQSTFKSRSGLLAIIRVLLGTVILKERAQATQEMG